MREANKELFVTQMNAMVQAVERGDLGTNNQVNSDANEDKETTVGGGVEGEDPALATTVAATADGVENNGVCVLCACLCDFVIEKV